MGHIEKTETLSASPENIWKIISDLSTWSDWFTIHERWMTEPPATLASGANLTAKIFMLGMANKIEWVVEDVVEPTKLVLNGTGMAGVKAKFAFELAPSDDGTVLNVSGDFEGSIIKGALGKAVEKDATKQVQASVQKLEALAGA
ncbi:type II toxin-antitoxin system Rv0910 family toxin [Gordonia sp. (in: high G+C Gram-positive bacteria)]|uniref:type II toxin-antitoxin system Rv0910 family toxin n=1 Tax=Gordonia sp. (in: high G+C Gram-positive bacteria) TaxID=84139 RepID=UPI003F9976D0